MSFVSLPYCPMLACTRLASRTFVATVSGLIHLGPRMACYLSTRAYIKTKDIVVAYGIGALSPPNRPKPSALQKWMGRQRL